ncbi:MAG: CvpA family protein [Gammaproteobacteria bacterium]
MGNLNWVDFVVIGICVLSTLAGLMRGFVRELFSLITWIAALFIAAMFATQLATAFTNSPQVQSAITGSSSATGSVSMVSIGISFIIIFIAVLIIGKILSFLITSAVEGVGIGIINRLLGGIFGFARGVVIVIIAMFLVGLTPFASEPVWGQAQSVKLLQPEVLWINNAVSPSLKDIQNHIGNTLQNINTQSIMSHVSGVSH